MRLRRRARTRAGLGRARLGRAGLSPGSLTWLLRPLRRRAGRLAGLLGGSGLGGTGLQARSLAGAGLGRSRRRRTGLLSSRNLPALLLGLLALLGRSAPRLPRLLRRARLGRAGLLGSGRLTAFLLALLALRRRRWLLRRAWLTGLRRARRLAALLAFLTFLLLRGTLGLALRAGPALRTLRGLLLLGLRLRPWLTRLLLFAPLLAGLLRFGLRQQLRRRRRGDLRRKGAAAQRQGCNHECAREKCLVLANRAHVPASERECGRHTPHNRARTMARLQENG